MPVDYTYRADHVGGLIAPAALSDALSRHARGELDADGLRQAEDAAVKAVLEMQKAVGLAVASDGELRRNDAASLRGDTLAKGEAAYLKAQARLPIKVTVPAPRPAAGASIEQALESAAVVKREMQALIATGVDYVQFDAPGYAALLNAEGRDALKAQGVDPNKRLDDLLRLDAAALSGLERPADIRIAVNVSRANGRSISTAADCLAAAERMFNGLAADRFLVAFDEGANFEPLRLVPKGKLVAMGLINAVTPALEDVEAVLTRIDDAAKVVDGYTLAVCPNCSFGGNGSALSETDQRRKLDLVVDVATRWWGFAM